MIFLENNLATEERNYQKKKERKERRKSAFCEKDDTNLLAE